MSEPEEVTKARDEALQLIDRDPHATTMRSCWNCNGAHEHLKESPLVIWCFECGHYFYKGIDITMPEEEEKSE